MKVDLLIFQLAVIFLPGLIWASTDLKYTPGPKPSETQFIIRTFLFGIVSYSLEFSIYQSISHKFYFFDLSDASGKQVLTASIIREVAWSLPISGVLAVGWLYLQRFKMLTRFLQSIRATKKYGDEDVWDYTFNSELTAVQYVHVRDLEHEFVFAGWVNAFSETEKTRELLLRDVVVSNFDGKELYTVPHLYLSRPVDDVLIEFPYIGESEEVSHA